MANFAPPPACTPPPLCTESSTCAPSPRRRPPARSTPSSTTSSCTESSTCALSLRRRMPARSTPSPTSSVHTICPSVWRHDRSLRHFNIFTPAKSGLDVFDLRCLLPAACAVNRALRSTQLPAAQRTLGGIALGDGGDCGWPVASAVQRSGEASALGRGCGDGGDCGRLSGVAERRFGEASTLSGRWLAHRAAHARIPSPVPAGPRRAGRSRTPRRLRLATRRAGRLRTARRLRPAVGHRRL